MKMEKVKLIVIKNKTNLFPKQERYDKLNHAQIHAIAKNKL